MMESALLVAQTGALGLIAAWLTSGVSDNIRYPENNETWTAEVLSMTRMKEDYPDHYASVAHRAITDRRLQKAMFKLVVVVELIACIALWVGVAALALALAGIVATDTARALALYGAFAFTAVWGGFLVVGNHLCYWFSHDGAQNTHYQMTLWGIGTMLLVVAG